MRRLRKVLVVITLSLLLLFMGKSTLHLSPIELAAAPHSFGLLTWEISHLPDKWVHKLKSFLPWNSRSHQERLQDLEEFFQIGQEIRGLERELANLGVRHAQGKGHLGSPTVTDETEAADGLLKRLDTLRTKRSGMGAGAEETLESEISAILDEEGLSSRIGLIFPPVDVALSSPPRVLVISPRDKIERMKTLLLKPDMKVEDMEALEEKIFREQDLAALVSDIGGVATYPTIVRDDSSLRHAAITAAHEWLHTYWFFRPLGWNFWSSPEMATLNETVADLAGQELGEQVYQALSSEQLEAPPRSAPAEDEAPSAIRELSSEELFDFNREMRETRLRADELLALGNVDEAEAYMEARRRLFVENGFYIRKLNQAYFAFHGTYATSPASVSPIGSEVERLRSMTDSVGDFIRTVSGFGSYQEFQDYLSGLAGSGAPGGLRRGQSPLPAYVE